MAKLNITPFTINVPQADIDDLYRRLDAARMPHSLSYGDTARGVAIERVQDVLSTWRHDFDWRAIEDHWNAFPQFMTEIDGHPFHFFHIRSQHDDATPLLLLHGFPGSFIEFTRVIDKLVDPTAHGGTEADAFHLVIPSLAGYAFSTPTTEAGWGSERNVRALTTLMTDLGYERFGIQGGDYSSWIGPDFGRFSPEHVIGVHVNAASVGFIPMGEVSEEEMAALSPLEQKRLARLGEYMADLNWYYDVQAKRPQAPSYGMADSPSGLAGWLLNLFIDFSGNLQPFTDDPDNRRLFLANLSLWWFTNCFASAASGTYYESAHAEQQMPEPQAAPTGVAVFANDVSIRKYAEPLNTNIVHWSDIDAGGHFAALEVPELLVDDVRAFFRTVRNR